MITIDNTSYISKNWARRIFGVKPEFIVIHHWGGFGQKAENVAHYLATNNVPVSAHFVIDATHCYQLVDTMNQAWHAMSGNAKGIGIECRPEADSADIEAVAQLIAYLWGRYGYMPLRRHNEFTATACPGKWQALMGHLETRACHYWRQNPAGKKPIPNTAPIPLALRDLTGEEIEKIAWEVYRGQHGNGEARKAILGKNYNAIQARVNEIVYGKKQPPAQPVNNYIEILAQRVIRGDFGNGEARKRALGSNYAAVQARVNQILGG